LDQASRYGGSVEEAILALGYCDEETLVSTLAEVTKTPFINSKKLSEMQPSPEALAMVPFALAKRLDIVPLAMKGATQLMIAVRDPMNSSVIAAISQATGLNGIVAVRGGGNAIRRTRNRFYLGTEADETVAGVKPSMTIDREGTDTATTMPLSIPDDVLLEANRPRATGANQSLRMSPDETTRLLDGLFSLQGEKGIQASEVIFIVGSVAARLGVAPQHVARLRYCATAIAVSNLIAGRRAHDLPTISALSPIIGTSWMELQPILKPLLEWPGPIPQSVEAQSLCLVFAFSGHVGQPRPPPHVVDYSVSSFCARFSFPDAVIQALVEALGE
jgi:hypothetical protein